MARSVSIRMLLPTLTIAALVCWIRAEGVSRESWTGPRRDCQWSFYSFVAGDLGSMLNGSAGTAGVIIWLRSTREGFLAKHQSF
jgi:hypothetical protein